MSLNKYFLLILHCGSVLGFTPRIRTIETSIDLSSLLPLLNLTEYKGLQKDEEVAIVNDYADTLLNEVNEYIAQQGIDPLPMEDLVESFQWTIFFGEVSLRNGKLRGIGSLERAGNLEVRYEYPNLKLHLPLSFESLSIKYDYKVQFMNFGPHGVMGGTVKGAKMTLDLNFDLTILRVKLDDFRINTLGKISLQFDGGILEWIIGLFANTLVALLKPIIEIVLNSFMDPAINDVVEAINNILEQILGAPSP